MALIKCSECGKEFSDKAPACPNCGCPTSEILKKYDATKRTEGTQTDNIKSTRDSKNCYAKNYCLWCKCLCKRDWF